eukprot:jgi/Botrbrau1/20565/Bobra.145_2s0112.1
MKMAGHWCTMAASSGNAQLLSYLLESGGAPSVTSADDEGWTPLHSTVSAGHEAASLLLLEAGADANAANSSGYTPLHYAASKGRLPLLRLLLKAGADVNARDKNTASTPLHRACSAGQAQAVRLLVEEGHAKVDALDKRRQTPLMVAVDCGQRAPALILVAAGANVEAEDEMGETPLSAAAKHTGLRETIVSLAKNEVELDELLEI